MVGIMTIAATQQNAAHLLRRAAWGGTPSEIQAVVDIGIEAAVDQMLDPRNAPDAGSPYWQTTGEAAFTDGALQLWWYQLAITSSTPAIERLGWFWHGHFASSIDKVEYSDLLHTQLVTLRRHGLGRFDDLLNSVMHDAAMNIYLDLHMSEVGNPNENFARELMELFTMGAGQGYTQTDVEQAARALTGYGVKRGDPQYRYLGTELKPELHDFGNKRFLGSVGNFDGADIIDAIVERNECHRFICGRLWLRYAGTAPEESVLASLTSVFAERLTISDVLATMLTHEAFYTDEVKNGLVLQPVELLVRTWRNFGLEIVDVTGTPYEDLQAADEDTDQGWRKWALEWLGWDIGQRVGYPPNVSGWGHNEFWLDTNGSSARVRVGREVGDLVVASDSEAARQIRSVAGRPTALAESVLRQFGIVEWSEATFTAMTIAASNDWPDDAVVAAVATAFASPEVTLA
jgi:uncharacterized protein (DUF1800 family)